MIKLVGKILTIILLVLGLNQLFYRFIIAPKVDYSWGYDIIHEKRKHLKANADKYNALFIGSSAMFRHIDPQVFDQHTTTTSSFNFGIQAMFPLQTAYTYEHLLEEDSITLQYAFMDLFEVGNAAMSINAVKKRTHYWYSYKDYKEALAITSQNNTKTWIKVNAYFGYTLAYVAKLFNAEIIEEILMKEQDREPTDFPFLLDGKSGFYPLDQEYEDKKEDSREMEMRRNAFLKDTLSVTKRIIDRRDFFRNYKLEESKVNQLHLDKLNELIAYSKEKGIHLIFILHPRLYSYQYPLIMPLYDNIDVRHKLNLNDTDKYKSFYESKYTFDALHLNEDGAAIFSKALAEEFNQLINQK